MDRKRSAQTQTSQPADDSRLYIGDLGGPDSPTMTPALVVGLLALSLISGFIVGLVVWATLWASSALAGLLWETIPSAFGAPWWLPLVLCPLGGLLIGLWTLRFNNAPEELETVMESVKKTGGYRLKGRFITNAVSFLLPLAFGGSIGPEAGLTGIIAAACTWIGARLRKAGIAAKQLADITTAATLSAIFSTPLLGIASAAGTLTQDPEPTYRKGAKLVLYSVAALGSFGGILLVKHFLGGGMELPRFESCSTSLDDFLWILPCFAAAYVLVLVYHGTRKLSSAASDALEEHPVLKPVLAGVVLGIAGAALPITLFSGEEQCHQLMTSWTSYSAIVLLLIAVVKVALTEICLGFGWKGGHFFPCIFASVACGYAIASATGADPMLMVIIACATFMGGIMRKPVVAAAMLLLCFPLTGMVWGVLAAVIGSKLPLPKALQS